MDYRADLQKIEAELPITFLLLGHGERDKNAGLVHADSTLAAASHPSG